MSKERDDNWAAYLINVHRMNKYGSMPWNSNAIVDKRIFSDRIDGNIIKKRITKDQVSF